MVLPQTKESCMHYTDKGIEYDFVTKAFSQFLDSRELKVLMPQVYLLKLKCLKHFSHSFKFGNTDRLEGSHGMIPFPPALRRHYWCKLGSCHNQFYILRVLPIDSSYLSSPLKITISTQVRLRI